MGRKIVLSAVHERRAFRVCVTGMCQANNQHIIEYNKYSSGVRMEKGSPLVALGTAGTKYAENEKLSSVGLVSVLLRYAARTLTTMNPG